MKLLPNGEAPNIASKIPVWRHRILIMSFSRNTVAKSSGARLCDLLLGPNWGPKRWKGLTKFQHAGRMR